MTDSRRFTFATYRVAEEKQKAFIELLKGAEQTMLEVGLITNRPVVRMRSLEDRELLLEVFEWADDGAFKRAQQDQRILEWWVQYESTWREGGFGFNAFPEAATAWAQLEPID